jgi:hypothetical protein
MKTNTIQHTAKRTTPLLKITSDTYPVSPRITKQTIGYFITIQESYRSPDENEIFKEAIQKTRVHLKTPRTHALHASKEYEKMTGEKISQVFPITVYDYLGIIKYKLVNFDDPNTKIIAFYFVKQITAERRCLDEEDCKKIIEKELKMYNNYINGWLYKFELYNRYGKIVKALGGFNTIEEIREHLPKQWKEENLEQYFINESKA